MSQRDKAKSSSPTDNVGSEVYPGPPRPQDILVGRGFQFENNPGNVSFYQELESSLDEYSQASTKKEKTKIVKRLYEKLTEDRDFIRIISSTGDYQVVQESEAKQKISHAMRYRLQLYRTGKVARSGSEENNIDDQISDSSIEEMKGSATNHHHEGQSILVPRQELESYFELFTWMELGNVLGHPQDYSRESAFESMSLASDTSSLFGEEMIVSSDGAQDQGPTASTAGTIDVASHAPAELHCSNESARLAAPDAYPFPLMDVGVDEISHVGEDTIGDVGAIKATQVRPKAQRKPQNSWII